MKSTDYSSFTFQFTYLLTLKFSGCVFQILNKRIRDETLIQTYIFHSSTTISKLFTYKTNECPAFTL